MGKIHALGRKVAANDRAAEKKIAKLTGVVRRNAEKSAAGRKQIAILEQANKNELRTSIRKAIATGEKRAQLVEKRGKKMDKDTQWLINNNLKEKIAKLQKETNASVDQLAAEGKRARAALKRQMIYAVKSMAAVAKRDLSLAMKSSVKQMNTFQKKASKAHAKSALQRAAIAKTIKQNAKNIAPASRTPSPLTPAPRMPSVRRPPARSRMCTTVSTSSLSACVRSPRLTVPLLLPRPRLPSLPSPTSSAVPALPSASSAPLMPSAKPLPSPSSRSS